MIKYSMDTMEFLEWITAGQITDAMMSQLNKCVANKVIGSIISALNVVLTVIDITENIMDSIEADKYMEMLDQMKAYGGIGAMKVEIATVYEKIYDPGTDTSYNKIYDQYVIKFVYGRNYMLKTIN